MTWKKYIGPGPVIAAAFIGPGTVTVCTMAGVNFGFELLWAMLLSILVTIVFQEMSARIGLFTQKGLATVLSEKLQKGILRYFSIALILAAIVLGNAAYEAGNISGAALGLEAVVETKIVPLGHLKVNLINLLIGVLAMVLLLTGSFKTIGNVLTGLVIGMSLAFIVTAVLSKPDWMELLQGFIPNANGENIFTVVALIGTTVVPYNLFLHADLVAKKWQRPEDICYIRFDTILAVTLGGIVSMAIMVVGKQGGALEVSQFSDLAKGIEVLMGTGAKYLMAFGLFAAGLTSAMTAPLAAAIVIANLFSWSSDLKSKNMRISMAGILLLGLVFSSFGIKPLLLISTAQVANGALLPLVSGYILWLVNRKSLMGNATNSPWMNILAVGLWLVTLVLGGMGVWKVLG
ncbi:Nramp family divalent metal transporter [Mariniradius sediminis]|uniref:Nramp family divalent metal transporter n=1 Tax=Mariniradius sediminis TaxID=2909237 RepID=A0ABS9BXC5_9BACT|nr:Nramp family divalent metal transporter [Mariniradius sediminis]MCF1752097.1 Nramp family divalent metal transporter [Mariniradius sediminis]